VGEAEISSKRGNDGESNMAALGTSPPPQENQADRSVDYLPWWNRSNCSPTHGIILIPIPINESSSILLPTHPIRMLPLMNRLTGSYPRYIP